MDDNEKNRNIVEISLKTVENSQKNKNRKKNVENNRKHIKSHENPTSRDKTNLTAVLCGGPGGGVGGPGGGFGGFLLSSLSSGLPLLSLLFRNPPKTPPEPPKLPPGPPQSKVV